MSTHRYVRPRLWLPDEDDEDDDELGPDDDDLLGGPVAGRDES